MLEWLVGSIIEQDDWGVLDDFLIWYVVDLIQCVIVFVLSFVVVLELVCEGQFELNQKEVFVLIYF